MIPRDASLQIARVPLDRIVVTEHQTRYPDRVLHYVALMTAQPDADAGLIALKPRVDGSGYYELLDGHHRYCAAILCGRCDLLALVIHEAEDCPDGSARVQSHPRRAASVA